MQSKYWQLIHKLSIFNFPFYPIQFKENMKYKGRRGRTQKGDILSFCTDQPFIKMKLSSNLFRIARQFLKAASLDTEIFYRKLTIQKNYILMLKVYSIITW